MIANTIYEGDNKDILPNFPDKSVDLIYADPPFFSNRHYELIWNDGAEIRAFEDRWKGGIYNYVEWMKERIQQCKRILKDDGTMFLHCDASANAHLRILMDEIFNGNFLNEIIWCYETGGRATKFYPQKHDTIFWYSKTKDYNFYYDQVALPRDTSTMHESIYVDEKGKKYQRNIKNGKEYRYYLDKGTLPNDWWTDIQAINPSAKERLGYPTQKPVALLKRIINTASKQGDLVLDPFCGCGTTLVASHELKRNWVGIDVSPTACKLMRDRLRKSYSISVEIMRGKEDIAYLKKLPPFEFQNWVVAGYFLGRVSDRKSSDMGIDGYTSIQDGVNPIQVKQSEDVGRNVVDNFETAIRRAKKKKGYIVAFSFGRGAYEEAARVKNQEGLDIELKTVKELLDERR
jgi:DNA modification methylase